MPQGIECWSTKYANPNMSAYPPIYYHDHCIIDYLVRCANFESACYSDILMRMIAAESERDRVQGNNKHLAKLNRELQNKPPREAVKHQLKVQAERIAELEAKVKELESQQAKAEMLVA